MDCCRTEWPWLTSQMSSSQRLPGRSCICEQRWAFFNKHCLSKPYSSLFLQSLDLAHLESLVIDEADLILSYGHSSEDIQAILSGGSEWSLPTMYQSFLMSATLTGEVDELKGVVLRNPVTIKLSDAASSASTSSSSTSSALSQYVIHTTEDDKFLLIYVLLKLRLVKGKVLIFVNDTDRGYRVKLFLEKFGIRAGVLNAELPFNSRYHAVQEFNRGVFQYLIATDESGLEGVEQDSDDEGDEENQAAASTALMSTQPDGGDMDEVEGQEGDAEDAEPEASASTTGQKRKHSAISAPPASSSKKRKSKTSFKTAEYGVTRGIDFVDVACVLNFDLPASSRSYVHRVGRTARAGRSGMSLSFVVPKAQWGPKHQHGLDTSLKSARRDEKIWKRIEKGQRAAGVANESLKEYRFDMQQVEGFRYRMEDGLRSVTRAAVREARIKELKNEVLNSEKLKAHFEDNPRDLAFLKHDKPLHPSRIQPHMKHVPSYLMPRIAPVGGASSSNADAGSDGTQTKSDGTSSKFVPFRKNNARGGKSARGKGRGGKTGGSRKDPLKTFKRK